MFVLKNVKFRGPANDYIHMTHLHITAKLQLQEGFNMSFKENSLQLGFQLPQKSSPHIFCVRPNVSTR
jgi:hypothetical protein